MKIEKVRDHAKADRIKIVVYGDAGTGKTTLIGTLPGKPLILSAESGLLSLRKFGDLDVVTVSTMDDLREAYSYLAKGDHGFDWVALDSLSEMAEVLLADEKGKTADPRKAYGEVITKMTEVVRAFRDLPMGVYMSAKEEKQKEEATGRITYALSAPGAKLGAAIPFLFDEVLRLVVIEDKETKAQDRWLQTANDGRSVAKDRSGALDPYEPPDLGAIVAKIQGTTNTKAGAA